MYVVHDQLRKRTPSEIASILSIIEHHFEEVPLSPGQRMLTAEELVALDSSRVVSIGAHTRRHPWLASLSATEQEEEIAGSQLDLETLLGRRVDEFAYPFGARAAFDGRSVRAVRRAGFALACTTFPDPLLAGVSRFRLPRRHVLDWEVGEFRVHLENWLAA
jgi:peptidoglycan/xylan/chitin deacetylase (PgdA/CDA1 family)